MLAQRAAYEGPRWTRAVEDQSVPIPEEEKKRNAHNMNVLAWDTSASRRARGWAGENAACSEG